MLERLGQESDEPMSIAELSRPFDITKSAVTKHVRTLERAGLLQRTIHGRIHYCRLNSGPLELASQWVRFHERFWTQKLDALEVFLEAEKPENNERPECP